MKILVTGGSTYVPIDKVRGITNIFRGRTACDITNVAITRGHRVTLLGNKHMSAWATDELVPDTEGALAFTPYKTYGDLYAAMQEHINYGDYDVVIHSAAVSDYKVNRVLEPAMLDLSPASVPMGGKISSSYDRLYLELVPTDKIIDAVRFDWEFVGTLVKFKLEVDKSDAELLQIAEKSRLASRAEIMVANCLEWSKERAFILAAGQDPKPVQRADLASSLITLIERIRS